MATNPLIRIPRRYRRQLHRIAARQARHEAAPQIRAIKQQRRLVNATYHQQIAANRQSINLTHQALNQIPLKGLTGRYRTQVKTEVAASNSMAGQAFAPLQASAQTDRLNSLMGIQNDLIQARADRQTNAAQTYGTLAGQERTYLSSQAQKRHQNEQDRRQNRRQHRSEIHQATQLGQEILNTSPTKGPGAVPWSLDAIKHFGSEEAAWDQFTQYLNKQADVSHRSAVIATRRIQRQLSAQLHGWADNTGLQVRPTPRHPPGWRP